MGGQQLQATEEATGENGHPLDAIIDTITIITSTTRTRTRTIRTHRPRIRPELVDEEQGQDGLFAVEEAECQEDLAADSGDGRQQGGQAEEADAQ